MDLMKNVPLGAWVFASVALVAVLAAFVVLAVTGSDSSELRWVILTILNVGGSVGSIGGIVYSGAAARSSHRAAEQTNGALDERIAAGVAQALSAQRAVDVAPGGEFRR